MLSPRPVMDIGKAGLLDSGAGAGGACARLAGPGGAAADNDGDECIRETSGAQISRVDDGVDIASAAGAACAACAGGSTAAARRP